jgi:hypothetical protein
MSRYVVWWCGAVGVVMAWCVICVRADLRASDAPVAWWHRRASRRHPMHAYPYLPYLTGMAPEPSLLYWTCQCRSPP